MELMHKETDPLSDSISSYHEGEEYNEYQIPPSLQVVSTYEVSTTPTTTIANPVEIYELRGSHQP